MDSMSYSLQGVSHRPSSNCIADIAWIMIRIRNNYEMLRHEAIHLFHLHLISEHLTLKVNVS